jgi:hypothetical protein
MLNSECGMLYVNNYSAFRIPNSAFERDFMANPKLRLRENAAGSFFVDSSCIDCDTCRQLAPAVFRDHGGQSSVFHQPQNPP